MNESVVGFFLVLMVAVGAFFGSMFTWTAVEGGWIKDCNTMGQHRAGNDIYTCNLLKKEQNK